MEPSSVFILSPALEASPVLSFVPVAMIIRSASISDSPFLKQSLLTFPFPSALYEISSSFLPL